MSEVETDFSNVPAGARRNPLGSLEEGTRFNSGFNYDDIPASRADLLAIIRSAPLGVFSKRERNLIETIINLRDITVSELMLPADKITTIKSTEILGPVILDQLYRSGLANFPVVNASGEIIGTLSTPQLNILRTKAVTSVKSLMSPDIYYMRADYNLEQALDAFLRTSSYLFLIVDNFGKVIGMLEFQQFCRYIFGLTEERDFTRDNDRLAVAKRHFPIEIKSKGHNV